MMPFDMLVAVSTRDKALEAELTHKGSLTRVDSLVNLKVGLACVGLFTAFDITDIFEMYGMCQIVVTELNVVSEYFLTSFKGTCKVECFQAMNTLVLF